MLAEVTAHFKQVAVVLVAHLNNRVQVVQLLSQKQIMIGKTLTIGKRCQ